MITGELWTGLALWVAAAAIDLTVRRREEAEAAARDLEALWAANAAHERRMDELLGSGPKDGQ
jgi:hypothetical protein